MIGRRLEPVTEQAARAAAELLIAARLHGLKYIIDAAAAEVALLTSDSDDITKLCGNQARVIPLWPVGPP